MEPGDNGLTRTTSATSFSINPFPDRQSTLSFENSPISQLDRDFKLHWTTMPISVLDLLLELIATKKEINAKKEAKDPSFVEVASVALIRCLTVLGQEKPHGLHYQLFILTLKQYFLLFATNSCSKYKNPAYPAVIPLGTLPTVLKLLLMVHLNQEYVPEKQSQHFSFFEESFRVHGQEAFFEAFSTLLTPGLSHETFESLLKHIIYWNSLLNKNDNQEKLLVYAEKMLITNIRKYGIQNSNATHYFLRTLSYNEIDLSMLDVWMKIFSELPREDQAFIRRESFPNLQNRFEAVEPVIEPKMSFTLDETEKILETVRFFLQSEIIDIDIQRGFIHYFGSHVPFAKLEPHEAKRIEKLFRTFFSNDLILEELDRRYLEIVSRNSTYPLSHGALKKWSKNVDWEKEACKSIGDCVTRQYPVNVIESRIGTFVAFFSTKHHFKSRVPIIKRDLYFELAKRSKSNGDKVKWMIKGLEDEPITDEAISPFLASYPGTILSTSDTKIKLATHIRFITLIHKCYKISPFIIDSWIKQLFKHLKQFKSVRFDELKSILRLISLNRYSTDAWKDMMVALLEIPLEDNLTHTRALDEASLIVTITEPLDAVFDSFLVSLEDQVTAGRKTSFDVHQLVLDIREHYYLNCIKYFIREFKRLDETTEKSLLRLHSTLRKEHLEDVMRKVVMSMPEKLSILNTKRVLCRLIDYCMEQLQVERASAAKLLRCSYLTIISEDMKIPIRPYIEFISQVRQYRNLSILFAELWVRQFVIQFNQFSKITYEEFKQIVELIRVNEFSTEDWKTILDVLNIPFEDELTKNKSHDFQSHIACITEPLEAFIVLFKAGFKFKKEEDSINTVQDIKDKYFLNSISNFIYEYKNLEKIPIRFNNTLRQNNFESVRDKTPLASDQMLGLLDRKIKLFKLINYCYEQLFSEKIRAAQLIEKM